jgi:rhodanese-related sulfurtransferase
MPGAWFGILSAGTMLGLFSVIFYHGIVRFYKARDWLSKRGAVLVDVDTRGEFACAHPRVAVNIPLESLARRAHEIGGPRKADRRLRTQLVARSTSRERAPRDWVLGGAQRSRPAHARAAQQGVRGRGQDSGEREAARAGTRAGT